MPDTTTPLAPMTPDAAISAFDYLRAVRAGDVEAAREFAGAEPRMPALFMDVAERIVVPITALPGPDAGEPCEVTFALEVLGRVFVWVDADAGRILTGQLASGKPLAIVCHAPASMPATRIHGESPFKGYRITGFTNEEEEAVGLADKAQ
ncbi:hypothetical protein GCM10027073_29220 [Streptomyces chlorus]|uniref:SseB protein N-terminal domain-containing protein n=1 Tax=Streptomyces chlorus TaxID=887452 RepID=A0ABW1E2J8_9ACTN